MEPHRRARASSRACTRRSGSPVPTAISSGAFAERVSQRLGVVAHDRRADRAHAGRRPVRHDGVLPRAARRLPLVAPGDPARRARAGCRSRWRSRRPTSGSLRSSRWRSCASSPKRCGTVTRSWCRSTAGRSRWRSCPTGSATRPPGGRGTRTTTPPGPTRRSTMLEGERRRRRHDRPPAGWQRRRPVPAAGTRNRLSAHQPMPPDSTGEMAGHGVYDQHSLAQHSAGSYGMPLLERAIREVAAIDDGTAPLDHRRLRRRRRSQRARADGGGRRRLARRRVEPVDRRRAHRHPHQRLHDALRDDRTEPEHVPPTRPTCSPSRPVGRSTNGSSRPRRSPSAGRRSRCIGSRAFPCRFPTTSTARSRTGDARDALVRQSADDWNAFLGGPCRRAPTGGAARGGRWRGHRRRRERRRGAHDAR